MDVNHFYSDILWADLGNFDFRENSLDLDVFDDFLYA